MISVWEKERPHLRFAPSEGKKSTDVLIIGGGAAGILCAYKLKQAGVDCLLLEATDVCGGITKNTTAKITLGHGSRFTEHGELIEQFVSIDWSVIGK